MRRCGPRAEMRPAGLICLAAATCPTATTLRRHAHYSVPDRAKARSHKSVPRVSAELVGAGAAGWRVCTTFAPASAAWAQLPRCGRVASYNTPLRCKCDQQGLKIRLFSRLAAQDFALSSESAAGDECCHGRCHGLLAGAAAYE